MIPACRSFESFIVDCQLRATVQSSSNFAGSGASGPERVYELLPLFLGPLVRPRFAERFGATPGALDLRERNELSGTDELVNVVGYAANASSELCCDRHEAASSGPHGDKLRLLRWRPVVFCTKARPGSAITDTADNVLPVLRAMSTLEMDRSASK